LNRLAFQKNEIEQFASQVGPYRPKGKGREYLLALFAVDQAKRRRELKSELGKSPLPSYLSCPIDEIDLKQFHSNIAVLSDVTTEMRDLYLARNLLATLRGARRPDPLLRPDDVPPEAFYFVSIHPRLDSELVTNRTIIIDSGMKQDGQVLVRGKGSFDHFWIEVELDEQSVLADAPRDEWMATGWAALAAMVEDHLNEYTEIRWRSVAGDPTVRRRQRVATSPFGAAWDALAYSVEMGTTTRCIRCGEGFTPHTRFRRGDALYCSEKCRRYIKRKRKAALELKEAGKSAAAIAKAIGVDRKLVTYLLKSAASPQSQRARLRAKGKRG